jgi:hypothetical protein
MFSTKEAKESQAEMKSAEDLMDSINSRIDVRDKET